MKILNITYNRLLGGLEQSFMDYAVAGGKLGHEVSCLVHYKCDFEPYLREKISTIYKSRFLRINFCRFLLKYELKFLITRIKPDIVIIHNERNIDVVKAALAKICPLVAVNHGARIKNITLADHIFVVNSAIRERLIANSYDPQNISVIGNMIELNQVSQDAVPGL